MPWQSHPFALTSGSLPVTRAGHCQDDPVSSCTDLTVTTLSAARPSYSPTWRRAGFFKGEGGVLALGWVCFPRLSQLRVPRSAPAKMPGEERLGRCVGTPAPAAATGLCRQGRAGQAPPSCFLFLTGTHPPNGHYISFITSSHLRDACDKRTPFPPAFLRL